MTLITDALVQAGFEPSTASIYEYLTAAGEQGVPAIQTHTNLSRVAIYDSLNSLVSGGFVEYRKNGRNAFYKAVHPNKLFVLIENRKQETFLFQKEMEQTIQALSNNFNLANNQPGVRFLGNLEDIKAALFDTLNTKGEILTFVEGGVIEKYLKEINEEYVRERLKKGIPKKIITTGNHESRLHSANLNRTNHTEIKFIDPQKYPFKTSVQIYDDTVLFLTLNEEYKIGFVIKNPIIAELHQTLFKFMWNSLPN